MTIQDELTVKYLRIGFLGFGKMGKIRYQTFDQMEKCITKAVYENDCNITTPENLKRKKSAEELIASNDIDGVVISVPNYLIKPYVIASLEAGKHVFCEKLPESKQPEL